MDCLESNSERVELWKIVHFKELWDNCEILSVLSKDIVCSKLK